MTIIVEKPVRVIESELARLKALSESFGDHSRLYNKGAIDALEWILKGATPPSRGGVSHFPPYREES